MIELAHDWLHDYTLLALRLNKLIAQRTGDDTLLDYYGPPELQAQMQKEETPVAERLVDEAQKLRETVTTQGFESVRANYLEKLVLALETTSRRVAGEKISLREQALKSFDVQADYTPEVQFERAYALYDEALAGGGSITGRLQKWREHYTVSSKQSHSLPSLIQRAVGEARQRTNAILPFPKNDEVTLEPIHDMPIRAMAYYLGNYQSKILINPDYPFNLADLLYIVCHEAYPGHLAELIFKEEHLIRRGYAEQQVSFLLTPPFVISEGLALWARELIFPGEEAARWLEEHIYPEVGIVPDGSQLSKVQEATDLLWGVRCNAALMLDDGYSTSEVVRYLERYALLDEAGAQRALQALQRPLCEAYIFTYHYGRQLLEPHLTGPDRNVILEQLLTQQRLPSQLLPRNPKEKHDESNFS